MYIYICIVTVYVCTYVYIYIYIFFFETFDGFMESDDCIQKRHETGLPGTWEFGHVQDGVPMKRLDSLINLTSTGFGVQDMFEVY